MPEVVGVRFKRACKMYYFDPGELDVNRGDNVIVKTSRGLGYATVVTPRKEVSSDEVVSPLRPVVRKATREDRHQVKRNEEKAEEAQKICEKKVEKHGLDMEVVDSEYAFDGSQLLFYFTADGRVDFRELVRDLASTFHTRIELRQIGVRDEAKIVGGIGQCGRRCCCTAFISDFSPVTIKMAKQQDLSLNPAKISGLCGRLMCCLQFEEETYEEAKKILPDQGQKVITEDGKGKVIRCNHLKKRVVVRHDEDGKVDDYAADEIEVNNEKQTDGS